MLRMHRIQRKIVAILASLSLVGALAIVLAAPENDNDTATKARRVLDNEGWEALDEFMSSQGYLHRSSRRTILWFKETNEGDIPVAETVYEGERAHLIDPEKEFEILKEAGLFPEDEDSEGGGNSKLETGSLDETLLTSVIGLLDPLPAVSAVHKSYYWLTIDCTCYDQNPENGRVTIVGERQWSKKVSWPADDDGMWVKWNYIYSHLYSHSSDGEIADAGPGAISFYIDDHDLSGTTAVCIAPNSEDYWGYSATGYYKYHHNWGWGGQLTLGFEFCTPYGCIDVGWTGGEDDQWIKTVYDQYTIGG